MGVLTLKVCLRFGADTRVQHRKHLRHIAIIAAVTRYHVFHLVTVVIAVKPVSTRRPVPTMSLPMLLSTFFFKLPTVSLPILLSTFFLQVTLNHDCIDF